MTEKKYSNIIWIVAGLLFVMACLFGVKSVQAEEDDHIVQEGTYGTNLSWVLYDDGLLSVTGSGAMQNYTHSTKLSTPWYEYRDSVTSIDIGSGITTIGDYAFWNFTQVSSVSLPETLCSIGDCAFYLCSKIRTIDIPSSVTSIGDYAFYQCKWLNTVEIHEGLEHIGQYAFYQCNFKTIYLPSTLNYMGDLCFSGCSRLTGVVIPDSITSLGQAIFGSCTQLTEVTLPDTLTSLGNSVFQKCAFDHIDLPAGLTSIGERTFSENKKLTSITIPAGVTKLGQRAFEKCTSLETITFEQNLTTQVTLGSYIFNGCTALTSVTLPNQVTSIGAYAFQDCTQLSDVQFGSYTGSIGTYAFYNCQRLTSLPDIPGISSYANGMFNGCRGFTSITIPDNITTINSYVFSNCSNLFSITIPETVTSIGTGAFYKKDNSIIYGVAGSVAETYAEANGFTFVAMCTEHDLVLVEELPYTCTDEGHVAYWTCQNCGKYFSDAGGIHEITLASTVTAPAHRWVEDELLHEINEIGVGQMSYVCSGCGETKEEYFYDENIINGGYLNNGFSWSIHSGGTLRIAGTGNMPVYDNDDYPWKAFKDTYNRINILDGITVISQYAFRDCTNVEWVFFHDSLRRIEDGAFRNCTSLKLITLPANVEYLGYECFNGCTRLSDVTLNQKLKWIGSRAFRKCPLGSISIPDSVTTLLIGTFEECEWLSSVELPSTLKSISSSVFKNCLRLNKITIPKGITTIEDSFSGSSLANIYYLGTRAQWDNISVSSSLDNVEIHYIDDPTTIRLEGPETLFVGAIGKVDAIYEEGENYFITNYTSSDPTIVSVDEDGNVYAWKEGPVEITGTFEDTELSDTITIAVSLREEEKVRKTNVISDGLPEGNKLLNGYSIDGAVISTNIAEVGEDELMRVERMSEETILVEYVDIEGNVKRTLSIPTELDRYVGFFAGEDNYYIVFVQDNPTEDDEVEVIRVVKFDKDWNRLQDCRINGINTSKPVKAGTVRMAEAAGILYIYTCHEMYKTEDGLNHQANLVLQIRESDMSLIYHGSGIGGYSNYVSHSFNQFVRVNNGHVYYLDHGDGYPRAIVLCGFPLMEGSSESDIHSTIFRMPGEVGANYTGVSIRGFEISDQYAIVTFDYDIEGTRYLRNAYVGTVNLSTGASEVYQLSNNTVEDNISSGAPTLVKISNQRFLIMWGETDRTKSESVIKLALLDNRGRLQGPIVSNRDLKLSECQPIVLADGTVSWYSSNRSFTQYYNIDPNNLENINAHVEIVDPGQEPTCTEKGLTDGSHCFFCEEILTEQEPIPAKGHTLEEVGIVKPTLDEEGHIAYYKCSECDALFHDEEGEEPITEEDTVIPKISLYTHNFGEADFTLPGMIEQIEESAFEGTSAESVYVPDTCTGIDAGAFMDSAVKKIRIPAGCTIDEDAFVGCDYVFIFGTAGSGVEEYCSNSVNCIFVEE